VKGFVFVGNDDGSVMFQKHGVDVRHGAREHCDDEDTYSVGDCTYDAMEN
jgi:hypothetical protein